MSETRIGDIEIAAKGELAHAMEPAPGLLPGEITKHPSPFKYVVIAIVLCIVTGIEIGISYLDGDIPNGLLITLLLVLAIVKFIGVAGWYMHLQTDQPIFRRFFILGCIAAVILYTIVLATLSIFAAQGLVDVLGAAQIPGWEAQPDVWLLIAAMGAGYWITIVRIGPRYAVPGRPLVTRLQGTCWVLGVLTTWIASDWPVHLVAERMNYSVHMLQHLMFAMVAAPLLLLGTPGWMARWVLRPGSHLFRAVRACSRFLPALILFNLVLVFTHWPALVNASLENGFLHFGVHVVLFLSSLIVWMPVLSPLPEIPRLAAPVRAVYLFLQSVVPTVPASFLTFGAYPLYKFYEGKQHLWGLTTLEDQQVAGLIMKIGAGMLLWALIAVFFFRWAADEERRQRPQVRQDLERELTRMGL